MKSNASSITKYIVPLIPCPRMYLQQFEAPSNDVWGPCSARDLTQASSMQNGHFQSQIKIFQTSNYPGHLRLLHVCAL